MYHQNEIKILHIHAGKDEVSSFIEFVKLDNRQKFLLQHSSFVKRFGVEMICDFKKRLINE